MSNEKKVKVALLGRGGVYQGFDEISADKVERGQVTLVDPMPEIDIDRYDEKTNTFIPVITHIAELDIADVIQSVKAIPLRDLTEDMVHLPNKCEEAMLGKYRYDRERKTFLPMVDLIMGEPPAITVSAEMALYGLMKSVADGRPLPNLCKDWMVAYGKSLDAVGMKLD